MKTRIIRIEMIYDRVINIIIEVITLSFNYSYILER